MRVSATTLALALVLLSSWPTAAQERYGRVEEWLRALSEAGAAANYEAARDVLAGPDYPEDVRTRLAGLLARTFKGQPFESESVTILPSERNWERRLIALFGNGRYLYVGVVLHRRESGWIAVHFDADPNYGVVARGL
ncbi:MAG: hypothetical protein AAGI34_05920 [Pseudomonadota bacterium]